jgi:glycerol-3-phosphate dehydrogenase
VNLCYPFMGRVLIGATDIPVDNPDAARCDAEEVAYMLRSVAEIFPGLPMTADHVRYRFCGVRPLPRADGEIGQVTRDHSIAALDLGGRVPVLCLIGGKWTTFRAFSAQAADRVLAHLGRARRTGTENMAIGGGRDFPRDPAARARWIARVASATGLAEDRVTALLDRYGTRGERVAAACRGETMLTALPDYSVAELGHLCRNERVGTLADLLMRRTLIALSGRLTPAAIEETSRVAAAALGWSDERRRLEVAATPLEEPAGWRPKAMGDAA